MFSLVVLAVLVWQVRQAHDIRGQAQSAGGDCTVSEPDSALDSEEQNMFTLVNTYRQQNGLAPYANSASLNKGAAWLSADMNTKNYFDHTDSLGRDFAVRLKDCGFTGRLGGENIAQARNSTSAFNAWKSSPGHNANMLDSTYKFIGIARSGNYWTQDFSVTDNSVSATNPVTIPAATATRVPQPTSTSSPSTITITVPSPACMGSCLQPTTGAGSVTISVNAQTPTSDTQSSLSAPTKTVDQNNTTSPATSNQINSQLQASSQPNIGNSENSNIFINFILNIIKILIGFLLTFFGRH